MINFVQFDTSATAVIMTRNSTRNRYEALLGGTQLVESKLVCFIVFVIVLSKTSSSVHNVL